MKLANNSISRLLSWHKSVFKSYCQSSLKMYHQVESRLRFQAFLRVCDSATSLQNLDAICRDFVQKATRVGANAIIGFKITDFVRVSTKDEFLVEREVSGNAIFYHEK